ncbi:MAG: phosphoribosyltransferase family protein [Pseudomonadota bacterium]
MDAPRLERALAESTLVFDAETIDAAIERLAVRINVEFSGQVPIFMIVMNGGLPFGAAIFDRFQGPCELDYVHVARYGHETSGGELRWLREPSLDVAGRTVILLDDVLDRGISVLRVTERLQTLGAQTVATAVLVRKAVADCVTQADYVALDAPDLFLFGRGMDYLGGWRNLQEIRALNPDAQA